MDTQTKTTRKFSIANQSGKDLSVAICIATYQRPELLSKLLQSLEKQIIPSSIRVEVRIVDNDADSSARSIVSKFSNSVHPYSEIKYLCEKEQNIALARNTALDVGPVDLVAFIDDDEEARPYWLLHLISTFNLHRPDAVFGPVHGRLSAEAAPWLSQGGFFDKPVAATGSEIDWKQSRTSNTLVDGSWFYGPTPLRFDPSLGRSGGSDSFLFSKIHAQGGRFITCREADAFEEVPASRATLSWLSKRWYRNGLIYEHISKRIGGEIHPLARFLRRLGTALLLACKGIFGISSGRTENTVRSLLRIALAFGGIVSWLRPNAVQKHIAYQNSNTESAPRKQPKVAFLTNIVSPYRVPVFAKLNERYSLKIFTDALTEFDRDWKVDTNNLSIEKTFSLSWKRTVRSRKPIPFTQKITLHLPIGLLFGLIRFRPEIVIAHELGFRAAIAAIYCALFRTPLVIWAYQSRISAKQGAWRDRFRKKLLSRATFVIGMGAQARDVLQGWDTPTEKIIDAPNAADQKTLIQRLSQRDAAEQIQAIRTRYAPTGKLAIVVGRLVPLKGIGQLLEAWRRLPPNAKAQWTLLFVGSGPLDTLIKQENDPSIAHVPNVPCDSIAFWYAAADLHIFPSCGDVWGLVVNEASHCGTPSLCSLHAGCADDMIRDGETGLLIDFTKPTDSQSQLESALNRNDFLRLGIAARHDAAAFTTDRLANGFIEAIEKTFTQEPEPIANHIHPRNKFPSVKSTACNLYS